jgi:phosphoadenosine phosphosulfate reductase
MALLDAVAIAKPSAPALRVDADELNRRYAGVSTLAVIEAAVRDVFPDRVALVSSFGSESSVLLHLLSQVDRSVPVVFLDTLKLFPETLAYRSG